MVAGGRRNRLDGVRTTIAGQVSGPMSTARRHVAIAEERLHGPVVAAHGTGPADRIV